MGALLHRLLRLLNDRQTRSIIVAMAALIGTLLVFLLALSSHYVDRVRTRFDQDKQHQIESIQEQMLTSAALLRLFVKERAGPPASADFLRQKYGETMLTTVHAIQQDLAAHNAVPTPTASPLAAILAHAPQAHAGNARVPGAVWVADFSTPRTPILAAHSQRTEWNLRPLAEIAPQHALDFAAIAHQTDGQYVDNPLADFIELPHLTYVFPLSGQSWLVGVTLAFPEQAEEARARTQQAVRDAAPLFPNLRIWLQDRFLPIPRITQAATHLAHWQEPDSVRAALLKNLLDKESSTVRFAYESTSTRTPAIAVSIHLDQGGVLGIARALEDVEQAYQAKWQGFLRQLYTLVVPMALVLVGLVALTGGLAWKIMRRLNAALQAARQEAEAAHRAKARFLATMSHEMRTPMNGVLGMAEILLDTELNEKQRHLVETLCNSGKSLLSIINELLDFSKAEAGKVTLSIADVDLYDVIDDVVELFAVQAQRKGIHIHTVLPRDLPARLRGDPVRLRQIFSNLLSNSIKFTEQGEIHIRVSLLRDSQTHVRLRVELQDSGIGMTPETLKYLFRPFGAQTVAQANGGSAGLGLAISQQLVEMMGGEIGARSVPRNARVPGQGSTLAFTLRLRKAEEQTSHKLAQPVELANAKVLVADGNAANCEIIKHHIDSWGMRCTLAPTGAQALAALREAANAGQPFDILLIDSQLPDMEGMALAKEAKAHPALAATRRVLLSAEQPHPNEIKDCGFSYVFHKPVRQSKLYKCLTSVMSKTAASAPLPPVKPRQEEAPVPATHFHNARILLAEDNQINQQVASIMLRNLGCQVDVAKNGRLAVEALVENHYDLILMDCQMPEMNGFSATEAIRAQEQSNPLDQDRIPIIALTANTMEGDREQCLAAGMDDYLGKPFNKEQLSLMLQKWLEARSTGVARNAGVAQNTGVARNTGVGRGMAP